MAQDKGITISVDRHIHRHHLGFRIMKWEWKTDDGIRLIQCNLEAQKMTSNVVTSLRESNNKFVSGQNVLVFTFQGESTG